MILTLTPALFGQYFDYVSLGYNTVTRTDQNGNLMGRKEYFLNDKRFSKMQIDIYFDTDTNAVFMEEKKIIRIYSNNSNTYNGVVVGGPLSDNFNYFEKEEGYEDIYHEIYRVENGKLVYVKQGNYISNKIEYLDTGIKVTMREKDLKYKDLYYINFYNIPETELYDKFMKGLVRAMTGILPHLDMNERKERYYDDKLKNLTRMELEIFKNCMLAKYGYSFQDPMWKDFMKKYNYYSNGNSSLFQAFGKFSIPERNLFELIQKRLADKYFVIGDYYLTQDNLRLRDRANLSGNVLTVISAYDWVKILEEGKEETIDDITSVWVKVKLLNNKEGWCFGGYLGY
jgi:hypothetical protein